MSDLQFYGIWELVDQELSVNVYHRKVLPVFMGLINDGINYCHCWSHCLLPEQITSSLSVEIKDPFVPHSLGEDSDPTQGDVITHTGCCVKPNMLFIETAEPHSSCLHTTADELWFHLVLDWPSTGLHSPWCFISSLPVQWLAPPTNLTSLDSVKRQDINQWNVIH